MFKPFPLFNQLLLCFLALTLQCSQTTPTPDSPTVEANAEATTTPDPPPACADTFSRDSILKNLRSKLRQGKTLTIHVFVPLCDNINQGIVRVNEQLGNGLNLRTNLYWGAGYGVSHFFKKVKPWKLLNSQPDPNPDVLERLVFEKKYANGAKVLLVADAYRGDRMEACLRHFLQTLAGQKPDTLTVADTLLVIDTPDLAIFNGHNGLMDMDLEQITQNGSRQKDAVVIACISQRFFREPLRCAGAYPLVTTAQLMAPEAYVISAVIDSWALLKPAAEVRKAAAQAYAEYQKCGYRGASGIFKTGW